MVYMIEKTCTNDELEIELTSYVDNKQNVWFRGKDIARILGYSKPSDAIERHVSENHKQLIDRSGTWSPETGPQGRQTRPQGGWYTFIDEAGFY